MSEENGDQVVYTGRTRQDEACEDDAELDLTLADFEAAQRRIRSVLAPTPVKESVWLSGRHGRRVVLKLESLQPSGSFKIRGAVNSLLAYREAHGGQFPALVLAASGGSHGLAVAYACQLLEAPACTIVIPENSARPHIIERLSSYGERVRVLVEGSDFAEADLVVRRLLEQAAPGTALYVHPYADRDTVAGQGTVALELAEQLLDADAPVDVDLLVGSVGGGGLMAGVSLCWRLLQQRRGQAPAASRIATVETEGADCWYRSVEARRLVSLARIDSVAKTLGARCTTPALFRALDRSTDLAVRVSDRAAVAALVDVLNNERILVEPACSCSVAALDAVLRTSLCSQAKTVCILVCGSNTSYEAVVDLTRQFNLLTV